MPLGSNRISRRCDVNCDACKAHLNKWFDCDITVIVARRDWQARQGFSPYKMIIFILISTLLISPTVSLCFLHDRACCLTALSNYHSHPILSNVRSDGILQIRDKAFPRERGPLNFPIKICAEAPATQNSSFILLHHASWSSSVRELMFRTTSLTLYSNSFLQHEEQTNEFPFGSNSTLRYLLVIMYIPSITWVTKPKTKDVHTLFPQS
jgi:hypothetical protein